MGAGFFELLGAAGGPSALALGLFYLLMRRDMQEVRRDIADLREQERICQERRQEVEDHLHGRITEVATNLAHLRGKVNGGG